MLVLSLSVRKVMRTLKMSRRKDKLVFNRLDERDSLVTQNKAFLPPMCRSCSQGGRPESLGKAMEKLSSLCARLNRNKIKGTFQESEMSTLI